MSLHILTCEPGWEAILIGELGRVFPGSSNRQLGPGWIESQQPAELHTCEPCVAFAAQCLPQAEAMSAPSISKWAQSAGAWLIEALREHEGPWRLHLYCVPTPDGPVGPARVRLIEQAVVDLLRKKQRRLLRLRVEEPAALWSSDEALVQIGLATATTGFVSATLPEERHRLRRVVSRFPGGFVEIPPDASAPSRAFSKLAEVQIRLGRSVLADEHCVDLGSSPGSWAYLALRKGAHVTAVDRSPLREDLMRHARLSFVRGDAFRYEPPSAVDWLLCDVIAYPSRTFELLHSWLERRWCRWFCTTVKFKGQDEYHKLEELKHWLSASGADFFLRRLSSNKNEVMAFGQVSEPGGVPWTSGL